MKNMALNKEAHERRKKIQKRKALWLELSNLFIVLFVILQLVLFFATKKFDFNRVNILTAIVFAVVLCVCTKVWKGFDVRNCGKTELCISHFLSVFATNFVAYFAAVLFGWHFISVIPSLILWVSGFALSFVWVVIVKTICNKCLIQEKLLVIYNEDRDLERITLIDRSIKRFTSFETTKFETYSEELMGKIDQFDSILMIGIDISKRNIIFKDCVHSGISVYVLPKVGDILLIGTKLEAISGELLMSTDNINEKVSYAVIKRLFDIVCSFILLIITLPISLVTALAIKLQDGGPVFYRQIRLTKDEKTFKMLKFRSMTVDAEKDGKARLSTTNDTRITRVGKFIRSCRIDEIPQILNILKGDMSFVGPRPERPEISAKYEEDLPEFVLRLKVKAGLTGYSQVFGRYNTKPYEKLLMDLLYIHRKSVWEDLYLIFATVRILFSKESTEGYSVAEKPSKESKDK